MKKSAQRILAVHLFNDYSGSPRVLAQWLKHTLDSGNSVELHTSATPGVLDEVHPTVRRSFSYRPRRNKLIGLLSFLWVQWILFWRIRRSDPENAVVYVNTLLPFGAILGARSAGIPIVCHVHEVSVRPMVLNKFLRWIAGRYADRLIFVSGYVKEATGLAQKNASVIPNTLSPDFLKRAKVALKKDGGRFQVLMLASIRAYKGLHQFIDLAERMPEVDFELVLNGTKSEGMAFFSDRILPENIVIWPVQKDVHPFYLRADLVMNLSLPDAWVETFGLTALEAMTYGKPVIVPPVGGIAELVKDGITGFHCDAYQIERLQLLVNRLQHDPVEYNRMGHAAQRHANRYCFGDFANAIDKCVGDLLPVASPILGQKAQQGILHTS